MRPTELGNRKPASVPNKSNQSDSGDAMLHAPRLAESAQGDDPSTNDRASSRSGSRKTFISRRSDAYPRRNGYGVPPSYDQTVVDIHAQALLPQNMKKDLQSLLPSRSPAPRSTLPNKGSSTDGSALPPFC